MQGLALSNPFKDELCSKGNCPLESTGSACHGNCSRENIVYKATCNLCDEVQEEEGVPERHRVHQVYIGETSRTLRVRSAQHRKDYTKCAQLGEAGVSLEDEKMSSFMWDHRVDKHQGDMDIDPDMDFKWEIISSHRDPLSRQVTEAVIEVLSCQ